MDPWEVITWMIKAQGVDFVFGIGDTHINMFANKVGIKTVNVRHEASAPFMAMAYARLSGQIGVCSASPGPGVASLVPGILEAHSGCSPLVVPCLSVSQKTRGMGEFQECDQLGMMRPITKWSDRVPRRDMIPWYLNRAFHLAINGQPGPIYLDLPGDVVGFGAFAEYFGENSADMVEPDYIKAVKVHSAADPDLIEKVANLLLHAERPIVVVGNGTVLSGAFYEFREFIELMGIPFMTTPGGRGILSEDHPLAMGLVGLYRTKVGKQYYSDADLLITIGSRNESFQSHGWQDYPKAAKFIQIDIDSFELGRNWIPDIGVVGDAGVVLKQLINYLKPKINITNFKDIPRITELIAAKNDYEAEVNEECMADILPLKAKQVVYILNKIFGPNTILVNENGAADTWSYCYPYFKVQSEQGCVPVAEQTCMGIGVVGAIAAKLAKPDKNVVCITGDGAFQMYMQELSTAAQYGAGCTWVILNNRKLGWINWLQNEYNAADKSTTEFKVQPDFVEIAKTCHCFGAKVEDLSNLDVALRKALKANNDGIPAVIDVIIDTDVDMTHFKLAE